MFSLLYNFWAKWARILDNMIHFLDEDEVFPRGLLIVMRQSLSRDVSRAMLQVVKGLRGWVIENHKTFHS